MTNTTLFNHLWNGYNEVAYTHEYILAYTFNKTVYMASVSAEMVASVICLDKASRGAGYAIRFCPNKQQKIALLPYSMVLCSEKYFSDMVAESVYNKGEIAEKLVTEYFEQEWKKDNVPFTQAGDIEVEGVAYQIKFEKATFCNEKSLANLMEK